ncbi:hypothetical protein AMTR_s00049p00200920 [Amborella trichopoda]|uniref:Uncharacterized protein n=1 Tax=Amborella trichopoda TaxID=13333 RepID=W1PZZ6_AMBTC|nr:hypothetical protein AMTR_s00049p00200920 [Amborella trichopoda]
MDELLSSLVPGRSQRSSSQLSQKRIESFLLTRASGKERRLARSPKALLQGLWRLPLTPDRQ